MSILLPKTKIWAFLVHNSVERGNKLLNIFGEENNLIIICICNVLPTKKKQTVLACRRSNNKFRLAKRNLEGRKEERETNGVWEAHWTLHLSCPCFPSISATPGKREVKTQTETHTQINFLLHFESFFWSTTILKDKGTWRLELHSEKKSRAFFFRVPQALSGKE